MSGINNIYSTVNSYTNKCRFCYSYTPPGPIDTCCEPNSCDINVISISSSCLSSIVNNSTRTTERSLLLASQEQCYKVNYSTAVISALQYTNTNISTITNNIYGQLLQLNQDRYQPYQPYMPPVIPPSVMELAMNTKNVGVPHAVFTIANCKGSQSVTTSDVQYN
jgi:hypothetical protein